MIMEAITKYMEQTKVSRNKLSNRSGIGKHTVYRIFNGQQEPTVKQIEAICEALDLQIGIFIKL